MIIGAAALAAGALVLPTNLDFLVGIYAFGAMLAFTIAHASVIALRSRERDRDRPYSVPLSIVVRGAELPIPAVVGAVASAIGWAALLVFHSGARYVGLAWLLGGLLLYVIYRKSQQKPLLRRVTIPERALRYEVLEPEFGSILVPVLGTALDDDIVQTAGRLAGETRDDLDSEGAVIEAIWVFEIPLALPMDAPLPDAQVRRAREALARAKLVGEEYEGVEVATAIVRARRAGEAIVREARRRGVEAIVLAAEESSPGPRRLATWRPGRPPRELRRRRVPLRDLQGAVPRDPDRAARGLAGGGRAACAAGIVGRRGAGADACRHRGRARRRGRGDAGPARGPRRTRTPVGGRPRGPGLDGRASRTGAAAGAGRERPVLDRDLVTTTKVAIPRPAIETEAEYESVLVAFDEHGYVPEVMATAARLAARRRRGIHVLVTIGVPNTSPISAAMPEQEAAAQSIIEEAKVQAGRRVSGHWEKVRAGQTGRRIVDEAKALHAAAIVMPMPRDGGGFGRALATVLRERPCRVIVESIPGPERRRPSVAA